MPLIFKKFKIMRKLKLIKLKIISSLIVNRTNSNKEQSTSKTQQPTALNIVFTMKNSHRSNNKTYLLRFKR